MATGDELSPGASDVTPSSPSAGYPKTIKPLRQASPTCGYCGIDLDRYGRQTTARYCSNRCKQLKYRDRQYARQVAAGTYRSPGGRRPGAGRPPGPSRRPGTLWFVGGVLVRRLGTAPSAPDDRQL
jgi:hypothetical protein